MKNRTLLIRALAVIAVALFCVPVFGAVADEAEVSLFAQPSVTPTEAVKQAEPQPTAVPATPAPLQVGVPTPFVVMATAAPDVAAPVDADAKNELIDLIIAQGKALYDKANGRAQRAQYAGDIYVCKNFTVHLFRENAKNFALADYPGVKLVIPNNLPAKESRPNKYGIFWQDVPAEKGNPFELAHQFVYDKNQTKQENVERALIFMRQVKRGDYFQMSADYQYGVGAHSLIFTADYDPDTDSVIWMDSNMNGTTKKNERYGYVQFDAVKKVQWFVDAFCKPGRGAALYRLTDRLVKR